MKQIFLLLYVILFVSCFLDKETQAQNMEQKMYITIGGETHSVTLVDNAAARELVAALENAPITVTLNDNDFEIWGALGRSLTTSNEQVNTQPGDIILYQGNQITIYYDKNTWNFTRLAKIGGAGREKLLEAFGRGKVSAEFWVEWSE